MLPLAVKLKTYYAFIISSLAPNVSIVDATVRQHLKHTLFAFVHFSSISEAAAVNISIFLKAIYPFLPFSL